MTYPGGKSGSGVYQQIINLMPPHKIYVEPFLGSGSIMRLKRPAPVASIGIDADDRCIQSFGYPELPGLKLLWGDAISYLLSNTFDSQTLIYLDPPYLMDTRSSKRKIYSHEFYSCDEHSRLLKIIKSLPCMVMISGYYSDLYACELQTWRSVCFQAQTRNGKTATEYVWLNFPAPMELHDYSYLGRDFRERERIKRKQNRWKKRLQTMPDLERHAILAAIEDLRSLPSS